MPNPNFNVDVWEQEESARQNERITRLGFAFAEILKTQRSLAVNQAPGLLRHRDVIDGSLHVYGATDVLAIHQFLDEAIEAGVIDRREVGCEEIERHTMDHTLQYMHTATYLGILKYVDAQYFLPEEE